MPTRRLSGIAVSASAPDNGGDHSGGGGGSGGSCVGDVFSTYLYEGTGTDQDIESGIDLSNEDGLVWFKSRRESYANALFDTIRGPGNALSSNGTSGSSTAGWAGSLTSFNANGFSVGADPSFAVNKSGQKYVSWTFRKAPKFFDVVTYTGTKSEQAIPHNLGIKPGMMIIKNTSGNSFWAVYTRFTDTNFTVLNLNNTSAGYVKAYGSTLPAEPDENNVYLNIDDSNNAQYQEFVAYLFAHDDSDESIIKCGSYTSTGGGSSVTGIDIDLGFEPQWILQKNATGTASTYWMIADVMRGLTVKDGTSYPDVQILRPNEANAESNPGILSINSTGFTSHGGFNNGEQIIYMAIRRPNKPAESGTEVFALASSDRNTTVSTGFDVDAALSHVLTGANHYLSSRLTGKALLTDTSGVEQGSAVDSYDYSRGYQHAISDPTFTHFFRRAPGFFDVVAYTGDGTTNRSIAHNLGVTPELIIYKSRSDGTRSWVVWQKDLNSEYVSTDFYLKLESSLGVAGSNFWDGPPTSSTFQLSGDASDNEINGNGQTYIAYLFASAPGISKVGNYTGIGANQDIDCGFTTGARFVLIKRTDANGDWMVFDTLRGISASDSPMLKLNETDAQISGSYIKPISSGFTVTSNSTGIGGAKYIFLAIA